MTLGRVVSSARRWGSLLILGCIGAVVFEVGLAVGWHYARRVPEPINWFSAWFVKTTVWCGLVGVFYLLAEPIRFRFAHLRRFHRYPPLWLSLVIAIGVAALSESFLPPKHTTLTPPWREANVLVPLALAGFVAGTLRHFRMRSRIWELKPARAQITSPAEAVKDNEGKAEEKGPPKKSSVSWSALKDWLPREEPHSGGPDLLGHGPIAEPRQPRQ
jgi:hypothetical protein